MDCPLLAVQLSSPASKKTTHGPLIAGNRLAGLNVPVPPGHAVVLSTTFVIVHGPAPNISALASAKSIAILHNVIYSSGSRSCGSHLLMYLFTQTSRTF